MRARLSNRRKRLKFQLALLGQQLQNTGLQSQGAFPLIETIKRDSNTGLRALGRERYAIRLAVIRFGACIRFNFQRFSLTTIEP